MKKQIQTLIENKNNNYKKTKNWKIVVGLLSIVSIFFTIYSLMSPAITETNTIYTLHLIDNYAGDDYTWKTEKGVTTSYDLKLHYVDTNGNILEGSDLTLELNPETEFTNIAYGFGYVPIRDGVVKGFDLIDKFNLKTKTNSNGDKYEFDHVEVLIGDTWQSFYSNMETSDHYNIYCNNFSFTNSTIEEKYSTAEPSSYYGWQGNYEAPSTSAGTTTYNTTEYKVNTNTEYKIVYKLVLKGNDSIIPSVGLDSGITFKLYDYDGNNKEVGINANGLYNYFTFRGKTGNINTVSSKINANTDADGFTSKRAKVEKILDSTGNPVFDCQGYCDNDTSLVNTSLGYLFGNDKNPLGTDTIGVHKYNPTNTPLLQLTNEETGIKYYQYHSNYNAIDYDIANERFLLRNYTERSYNMTTYPNESSRYEFLPFNYWDGTNHTASNSREYQHEANEINHWYGMTMEFDFYMPKNGILTGLNDSTEAMKFEFSGDDDVWVFIDDVLVLDLGGTHGAVDGYIDFNTGKVEGYLKWNGSKGTSNTTSIYKAFVAAGKADEIEWNDDKTTFKDFGEHTLKFFYLERGASVANCKIKFNMPVLPPGSLWVQKDYEGTVKYPEEQHEFTLYKVNETETGTFVENKVPNTEYKIGGTVNHTTADGKFYLKANEVAIFELADLESYYYVKETTPGTYSLAANCTLNGTNCQNISQSDRFTIIPGAMQKVIFTNKIKTFNINVTKNVIVDSGDEKFEFEARLVDEKGSTVIIPNDSNNPQSYIVNTKTGVVTFNLKNGESVTIKNIPINTNVTLQETKHDGYNALIKSGDVVLANGDIAKNIIVNTNKDITVYNIPGVRLPDTGGIGIEKYIVIGIGLILISIICGYNYFRKLKGSGK